MSRTSWAVMSTPVYEAKAGAQFETAHERKPDSPGYAESWPGTSPTKTTSLVWDSVHG